jgi:hypothetical protein
MALSGVMVGGVAVPAVRAAPSPPARTFRIGLIGDTGYKAGDDANLLKVRAGANRSGLAFVVHDGDIQKGDTPCSDKRLRYVKGVFDGFSTLVYTPGDNEWLNCRTEGMDPLRRLAALRRAFFGSDRSRGATTLQLERQTPN